MILYLQSNRRSWQRATVHGRSLTARAAQQTWMARESCIAGECALRHTLWIAIKDNFDCVCSNGVPSVVAGSPAPDLTEQQTLAETDANDWPLLKAGSWSSCTKCFENVMLSQVLQECGSPKLSAT